MTDRPDIPEGLADLDAGEALDVLAAFLEGADFLAWPYDDLELLSPACPGCGGAGRVVTAPALHPIGACPDEACPVWLWDPSCTPEANLANAGDVVIVSSPDAAEGRP